jgi:hypothetical protein
LAVIPPPAASPLAGHPIHRDRLMKHEWVFGQGSNWGPRVSLWDAALENWSATSPSGHDRAASPSVARRLEGAARSRLAAARLAPGDSWEGLCRGGCPARWA